jgi:trk system potassium uptake protein
MAMNFIVVGCGRLGSELAQRLYEGGHRVTVVDPVRASFDNLSPGFRGQTIEGEALNQDVLRRAGIAQADGLAAATNVDSINAVVAHIARSVYHVPNVVVRNYDPRWRPVHESFGLHMVSSTSWGAQRLEEMLYQSEIRTVFSAGNGEVEIYEFGLPATWNGASLADLFPESTCTASAITRAGKAQLPSDDVRLETGDVILVSATMEGILALRQRLGRAKEA